MKPTASWILASALVVVVAAQQWQIRHLSSRVASLEVGDTSGSIALDAKRSERRGRWKETRPTEEPPRLFQGPSGEARNDEGTVEGMPEDMRVAVEEAIARREQERRTEKRESWVSIISESMDLSIAEVAETYDIAPETQAEVLAILTDSVRSGMELRSELEQGSIGVLEARDRGAELKSTTADEVTALIGEEAADELWAELEDQKRMGK